MIIYFIQEDPDGPIKIGQTNDVNSRICQLQTGCSRKLKVLYSFEVPNDRADYAEKHIHGCFSNRRLRGEWFNPCPYLYDYIEKIKSTGFWVDWKEALDEECESDRANNDLYNLAFKHIEKIRHYGDKRQIQSLIENLIELTNYAKCGRM